MYKTRSSGVTVFGYLLILGSLYQILILLSGGYVHYSYLHQEYPPNMIMVRYCVSWIMKISGLVAGIGILNLNDPCRVFAIFNSVFTIMTVHLKHTYAAYSLHTKYLDHVLASSIPSGVSFPSITGAALFIQRLIDIIFGVALIYFLTRPTVKKQFQDLAKNSGNNSSP